MPRFYGNLFIILLFLWLLIKVEFGFLAIRRMHLASAFIFYGARSWYLRIACASHGFAISPGISMQAVPCVMNFTLNGCDDSETAMRSTKPATTTNDDDVDQPIVVFAFDFLHSICIKLNTRLFGLPLKCNANLISYAVTCAQLDRRSSCESWAGINYVHIFCFIHDLFICNFSLPCLAKQRSVRTNTSAHNGRSICRCQTDSILNWLLLECFFLHKNRKTCDCRMSITIRRHGEWFMPLIWRMRWWLCDAKLANDHHSCLKLWTKRTQT